MDMIQKRSLRLGTFSISALILVTYFFHSHILKDPSKSNFALEYLNKRNVINLERSVKLKTTQQSINFTLQTFNRSRPIVFLHICKSGGTSFDKALKPIVEQLKGRYVGTMHSDWSYIETIPNADVVVMLREPVARAVSFYHYKRAYLKNKLNTCPLKNYLHNPKKMIETQNCWQDGQASVSWLTGTQVITWLGVKSDTIPARERRSLNISEMCLLAARRLENIFWFGIIEDIERSLELLQYQLGCTQKINFPKLNQNKHSNATEYEQDILASLMPQDIWLYQYAKQLFEARWTYYKTGVFRHPNMPPTPTLENVPCISTRFILLCRKGPLSPLYYVQKDAPLKD